MNAKFKQGFDTMTSHLKEELRFYVGIAVASVAITASVLLWANETFPTLKYIDSEHASMKRERVAADDALAAGIKGIDEKLGGISQAVDTLLDRRSLESVMADINETKANIAYWRSFIAANNVDTSSGTPLESLDIKLESLEIKRSCIIGGNPVCN